MRKIAKSVCNLLLFLLNRRHLHMTKTKCAILTVCIIVEVVIIYINLSNEIKADLVNSTKHSKNIPFDLADEKENGPHDWTDPWYCKVECAHGVPCQYKDEVDFRIIVMTFQRDYSLNKCLDSILDLETLGDRVSVEIWIDRSVNDVIDHGTVIKAESFQQKWSKTLAKGRSCIHLQSKNAYISGQWINTWRPKPETNELALILEDDISISPLAYKWLKETHKYFKDDNDIAGYTLQMEQTYFFAPNYLKLNELKADVSQTIFLYPVIGSWGYAPHPKSWRQFQDWYHKVRPDKKVLTDYISPIVPGIRPSEWYRLFLSRGTQESMWEMWHIKFAHDFKHFTVYSNLKEHTGEEEIYLGINRKEAGLHYSGSSEADNNTVNLLKKWNEDYVKFPDKSELVRFNYDGRLCEESCCFTTLCGSYLNMIWSKSLRDKWKLLSPF